MLPPTVKRPAWNTFDAEQTRIFLDSAVGQRFLTRLMYAVPEYGKFTSIEERAVKSGQVEGYELCVSSIQALREPDPEPKNQQT